ncbi:MAG: LLM class flavin-dependent oxidoreductase [Bdellovibrionales bacterium]|nr:LLM class flavin-dependent oxidoreductase [Bdellovibrionales bacterium]
MKFDVFFSICQTPVDGHTPSERQMFLNFFDQVVLADELGYETAWVAETHLSCQIQKQNPGAVIPQFQGEIGLNTDILQLAHKVFAMTKKIHVGSAIRNILCNGGPIAHAEAVKTFMSFHSLNLNEKRKLKLGFAAGRFPFSNFPYGIYPRSETEQVAWPVVKGKIFLEATEIFLRLLNNEVISQYDLSRQVLTREDFKTEEHWQKTLSTYQQENNIEEALQEVPLEARWKFDKVGVIPFEAPMNNLELIIGSHDPKAQKLANTILPVGVFNLSITPSETIEATHKFMQECYHSSQSWKRDKMPRTVLLFVNDDEGSEEDKTAKAREQALRATENYWKAMEGTLDPAKIEAAVDNSIYGSPAVVAQKIQKKYHPEDRLMIWFDFNNHNNEQIKQSMSIFMNKVVPLMNN